MAVAMHATAGGVIESGFSRRSQVHHGWVTATC